MRYIGTQAKGIRLPIISQGDSLAKIVADFVALAAGAEHIQLAPDDVVAITEAVVAKAQGNYASLEQVSADVRRKFPGGVVGIVAPILSRNRFFNILKGIAMGVNKVCVLLTCPSDEVGNPLIDPYLYSEIADTLPVGPIPAAEFRRLSEGYKHPFTGLDYMELYESAADNVEVFVSNDIRDILKLTRHVLAADIHTRFLTQKRLLKAGAETVLTLSDILSEPVNNSGYNPDFGVLGSNVSSESQLKLFPRDCAQFVHDVQDEIFARTKVRLQVMVYGDGAYKDPAGGIWELADPVVSPAYTEKLGHRPNEIKIKMVADQFLQNMDKSEKEKAIKDIIRQKTDDNPYNLGTTPRKYADLLGSLCDLLSGSGDKGTPVILVQGYFDNFANED